MPNHCYQTVDIKGDVILVNELCYALTDQDRFCDFVLPMPIEMREKGKWHDWRKKNWGTKWDLSDVEIIETDGINIGRAYSNEANRWAGFSFKCWTAWSPPIPVWEKLTKLNICVTAYYFDEGGFFCGIYEDGEVTEDQSLNGELGQIVIKNALPFESYEMEEAV